MAILLIIPAVVWLIFSGLLDGYSEYISKLSVSRRDPRLVLFVGVTSGISSILWLPALLHKNQISIMGTAWILITTLTTLVLAIFVFRERISFTQAFGIVLAIISVILLGL